MMMIMMKRREEGPGEEERAFDKDSPSPTFHLHVLFLFLDIPLYDPSRLPIDGEFKGGREWASFSRGAFSSAKDDRVYNGRRLYAAQRKERPGFRVTFSS